MIPKDSSGVVDVVEGDKSLWTKKGGKLNESEFHGKLPFQAVTSVLVHSALSPFPLKQSNCKAFILTSISLSLPPQDHFLFCEVLDAVHFVDTRKAEAS